MRWILTQESTRNVLSVQVAPARVNLALTDHLFDTVGDMVTKWQENGVVSVTSPHHKSPPLQEETEHD